MIFNNLRFYHRAYKSGRDLSPVKVPGKLDLVQLRGDDAELFSWYEIRRRQAVRQTFRGYRRLYTYVRKRYTKPGRQYLMLKAVR